ncbi:hypothetical protein FACS189426_17860 [Bacteroidia bacterium]|nr:hypothetical protein FACS189426_17860 [Bacteroidia bacterium]GHV70261.1 hypothetical protein FACS189420_0630 [Bacteroidia bacterium]
MAQIEIEPYLEKNVSVKEITNGCIISFTDKRKEVCGVYLNDSFLDYKPKRISNDSIRIELQNVKIKNNDVLKLYYVDTTFFGGKMRLKENSDVKLIKFTIIEETPCDSILPDHNEDWEWEDLTGEVGKNFVKIRIVFKIIIDQFSWKIGDSKLLDNGRRMVEELPQYLDKLPDFEDALGVIAVGTASQENYENVSDEVKRAGQRADNIRFVLDSHPSIRKKEIYTLNLGVHEPVAGLLGANKTSYQRRIIIIGVMDKSENIGSLKFEECLRKALEPSKGLSFDKNKYSSFDLKNYQIKY